MTNVGEYSVAVDANTPASFLVQNSENKPVMKLNSAFFIGVDDQTPSNFVVKNKDDEVLFQLNQEIEKNNLITKIGGYTLTIDGDNPAHFLIKNAEERELMRLNPDYFIGVDDQTPSNFVIKNKVGEILFQLNQKKETQPEVQRPSFNAYLSKTLKGPARDKYFIPDKTLENIGNHYNPSNGIFTAPINGLYQFACKLTMITNGGQGTVTIEIGDKQFPETTATSVVAAVTHSALWSGLMKANETARCLFTAIIKKSPLLVTAGSASRPQSTFSGSLLA